MHSQPVVGRNSRQAAALLNSARDAVLLFSGNVIAAVYGRGQAIAARLATLRQGVFASAHTLSEGVRAAAEMDEGQADKGGLTILGLSGVALALVIGLVVLLCIIPVCVILVLALLGPAIGNVFSDITEDI